MKYRLSWIKRIHGVNEDEPAWRDWLEAIEFEAINESMAQEKAREIRHLHFSSLGGYRNHSLVRVEIEEVTSSVSF